MKNARYMLLDITGGGCALLSVAPAPVVQMQARLVGSERPTALLLAPPIEGRGFAKLTVLQLGALITSLGGKPAASYHDLCAQAFELVLKQPEDTTSVASLEREIARRGLPDPVIGWKTAPREEAPPSAKKERSTEFSEPSRPKAGTTTGYIWELCDKLLKKLERLPTSKEAWAVCSAENVKQGTFSVQFGKWKKHQEG
jgi:hypothetical protein